MWVLKRSGQRVPFDRTKVVAGIRAACKNRPVRDEQIGALATEVEETMREEGPQVTSEQIGRSVLERLRLLDDVASVRFASVYKGFADVGDFARELGLLERDEADAGASEQASPPSLEKQTAPKLPLPSRQPPGE